MCLRSESNSDKNRSGTQTGQTTKNTTATLVSSLYAAVPHLRLKSARENSTAAFGPSWKEMHDHEMKISEQTLGKKQKSRPSERGSADSTAEYNREPRGVFDAVTTFSEPITDLPEAVRSRRPVESSEFILATRFRRPLERDGAMFLGLLGTAICPDPVEEEEVRCTSAAGAATPRLLEHDDLRQARVSSTIRNHAAIRLNGKSALNVRAVAFELVMHLEGTTNDKMSRLSQSKTLIQSV